MMREKRAQRGRAAAALCVLVLWFAAVSLPARAQTAEEVQTEDASGSDSSSLAERIGQEKEYLLQAMDRLQELGLSPIAIWADITSDDSVLELISEVTGSVGDAVSEAVSGTAGGAVEDAVESAAESAADAGSEVVDALADEVAAAVQEQAEEVKQGILEKIREAVNEFLDNL